MGKMPMQRSLELAAGDGAEAPVAVFFQENGAHVPGFEGGGVLIEEGNHVGDLGSLGIGVDDLEALDPVIADPAE